MEFNQQNIRAVTDLYESNLKPRARTHIVCSCEERLHISRRHCGRSLSVLRSGSALLACCLSLGATWRS